MSADGSDSAGDGTIDRPYQTVNHVCANVIPYRQTYGSVSIIPLTDIVEKTFNGFNQCQHVIFNSSTSGHTITFNKFITLKSMKATVYNCRFNGGLNANENGFLVCYNSTVKTNASISSGICSRYNSLVIIDGVTIENDAGSAHAIRVYNDSYLIIRNGLKVTGEYDYAFNVFNSSTLHFDTNQTIGTAEASGGKYLVERGSILNLNAQGEDLLGENLTAGSKDESSIIC